MPHISRLLISQISAVGLTLQWHGTFVEAQSCVSDCADPANGPGGAGCSKGGCVDGTPGDSAFTCQCPGQYSGHNCETCKSSVWKNVVCSADGTETTYQQYSDDTCTTTQGSANIDQQWQHNANGGVALGAEQCHHPPGGPSVSYSVACEGETGAKAGVFRMWQGPSCGALAEVAGKNPNAGACECVAPQEVRTEYATCEGNIWTNTVCAENAVGSIRTKYSDKTCTTPLADSVTTSAKWQDTDDIEWDMGPASTTCNTMEIAGDSNNHGMTITCQDGKGLRTVYQGETCTGDIIFSQHDDFCHCAAPPPSPPSPPDCASPANGPGGEGCAPGTQCIDGTPNDSIFTCRCPPHLAGANCQTCVSGVFKTTQCNNGGTGSIFREWSDSSCTTRRTNNDDVTDTLFLHSEMGGVALDACHHPPDQRGQMSYKMTCDGDAAVQTMWQGPVCGDETDMAGQNPNAGGCQCADPHQIDQQASQQPACASGVWTNTHCSSTGLGSVKTTYSDSSCTALVPGVAAITTEGKWLSHSLDPAHWTDGAAMGPDECHAQGGQQGGQGGHSFTLTCSNGKGLRTMYNGHDCAGDEIFTQHDDWCTCAPPTPPAKSCAEGVPGTPARPCTPGGAVAEVAAAAVVCDVNTHTGPVRVDTMCASATCTQDECCTAKALSPYQPSTARRSEVATLLVLGVAILTAA